VADLAAELEAEKAEAEPELSPPPPVPPAAGGSGSEGLLTQRNIIIAVVVLLVLCCCCCAIASIVGILSNEDIMREFTFIRDLVPTLLAFV
jgi:hypothetical protein